MAVRAFETLTYRELEAIDKSKAVAVLPVGAIEAHGPHLPLSTDVIISQEMARRAAEELSLRGHEVLLLPPIVYTCARFAREFVGTVDVGRGTLRELVTDVIEAVRRVGVAQLCVANSHLDPDHLHALRDVQRNYEDARGFTLIFPDITRRRWVEKLTEEFKSGSCHAGRFETSLVLAARPDLVKPEHRKLQRRTVDLANAIRGGAKDFVEIGMPDAYCGDPAAATAEEGERTYRALTDILVTAFLEGAHATQG